MAKLLDIGFYVAFDRPFNPVDDWSFFSLGVETVRNTFGGVVADLTVAGVVVIIVAALAIPTLAVLRLTRVATRYRRHSLRAAAGLATLWVVFWALGAQAVTGMSIASTVGADLAVQEVHAVRSNLRDRERFSAELQVDRFGKTHRNQLLAGLRGKDVLLVFVESYGKLAVEGSPFSPSVDAVLDAGTRQLADAGFSARSGWLTSSTFGGASWWAHATMQSGTWIDTQGRYDELVKSNRLTLATAFGREGWRTVADTPANERAWPEGTSFYHYDRIYDGRDLNYHGPTYGFAPMPDQYVLLGLQRLELAKPHAPLFAEIDLVSSHTPWTRIPPFIPWELRRERVDLRTAGHRPQRVDRHAARVLDVDRVHASYAVLLRPALRSRQPRAHRARRSPAVESRDGPSWSRRACLDHRPRPESAEPDRRLGVGGRNAPGRRRRRRGS